MLVAVLVVVGVVGYLVNRGVGPLPDPEGCHATVQGHRVDISIDQAQNASVIAAVAVRRGLPARAVSIALATAFQESKLTNLANGDRDSVGIFQQRPSMGWGTKAQILDPYYATNRFYDALLRVPGYEEMRITVAAQRVQRSGFPEAYAVHEADARALASALTGYSPGDFSCVVHAATGGGSPDQVSASLGRALGLRATRAGPHSLVVALPGSAAERRRLGWVVSCYLLAQAKALAVTSVDFDGHRWVDGRASEHGWRRVGRTGHSMVHLTTAR
jgi:hypothetical protein